ncbi:unnamed protein product, partial [Staurois parvus]
YFNPPGGIPECSSGGNPELHSGLPCGSAPGSLNHLPCPALPRCPSCSVPCNVLRRMPASVIWVLSPASVRTYEDRTAGNLKMTKSDIH